MDALTPCHLSGQRSAGRACHVSLTLFALALAVYVFPGVTELLQYDRSLVAAGEWWRVVTCQWTHWNASNLFWDAVMFLVLGAACERGCRRRFVACVAASAVLIPSLSLAAAPHMSYFRGLSGVDSALFVLWAANMVRANRLRDPTTAWLAGSGLVLFAAKTIYECTTGSVIFVKPETAFTPLPMAHVVGGAIGLAVAFMGDRDERKREYRAQRTLQVRSSIDGRSGDRRAAGACG